VHVALAATPERVAAVIKSNTKDDPTHSVLRLVTRGDQCFAQDEVGSFHTSKP
jgi:hypothetical protein